MSKELDYEQIKKDTPFRERIEIGMRMLVKLMFESKNEHVLLVCFHLSEDQKEGTIDSVIHTSPGNAEAVLAEALRFYSENEAMAHEETLSDDT